MRDQLNEIEPIANNSEKPTFDNTIVALERTGRLLDRAERTFSNLNACDTNPTRQKIDKEMAPKLAAHHDEIFLNSKLFARVQQLYENRDKLGLDPESVAALTSTVIAEAGRAVDKLELGNIRRMMLTSSFGRLLFEPLGELVLVVATEPGLDLEHMLLEIAGPARRIREQSRLDSST